MQNVKFISGLFCVAVIVIFTSAIKAAGQTFKQGAPFIRNYTANEINAGSSEVFCWAQDNRGMVYIGNNSGITEFNGREWHQIKNSNSSIVRDIVADSLGRIFVGASNDFGLLQPDSLGNMEFKSLAQPIIDQGIIFNDIWEIVPTSHGIYFCANRYIFKYSNKRISVIPVDFLVQDIYFVNNKLYMPTEKGMSMLEDTTLVPVSKTASFWITPWKGEQFLTIDNKLELATLNISTFETSPFESPVQEILKKEEPFEIERIDENYFLVTTLTNKIIILSNNGDIIQIIDRQTGLMNGSLYRIFVDRDKNLWACMSKGIAKIDISYPILKFEEEQNVTSNVLASCLFEGVRYIATLEGIYYLPPFNINEPDACNKFVRLDADVRECWEFHIYNNQLYAVCSQGIWLISGTKAKLIYDINSVEKGRRMGISPRFSGIFFLSLKNRLLALKLSSVNNEVRLVEQFEFPEIKESITKISSDKEGNLWINTRYGGVYYLRFLSNNFKNYQVTLLNKKNGISSLDNTQIFMVNDSIVLTTQDGILQPRLNNGLTPDSLIKFTYSTIFGDTIYDPYAALIPVTNNKYLISGNGTYFAKLNGGREAFEYRGFDRLSFIVLDLSIESDSIISICSDEGLFNYNLKTDNRDYQKSFNTIISQVVQDGDSTLFGGCFYTTAVDSTKVPALTQSTYDIPTIDYKFNSITFHVAALFFEDPELTEFQYRLEGFDKKWSNWSKDNKITYTRLPAGEYIFRAQAKNGYGALSNVTEYKFSVATPWFLTWWAYTMYIVISGAVLYMVARLYTAKLKRQKEQLELIVKNRTREIQEQASQLKSMNDKLIEMDNYKQGVNNMIVHDLKNPISAIINFSDLIGPGDNDNVVRVIKQSGEQMLHMVSNILDVSKYEDSKLPLNTGEYVLFELAQNAINQVLFLSNIHNISIENRIASQLNIKADREIIERVFVNLLTNAIKFSPVNSVISIRAEVIREESASPGYVQISVTDHGIGIAEDKVHLLFQKFGQVTNRNLGVVKSTGLGLAFCKMAIEAHDGKIGVKTKLNEGSTFWFTLPIDISVYDSVANENEFVVREKIGELSEQSKYFLQEFLAELQKIEFYKVSEILSVLNRIETQDKEIVTWKNNVINAINSGNEGIYLQLILKT